MKPQFTMLDVDLVRCVIDEALELMQKPGIKVQSAQARALLLEAGAVFDNDSVARIPEDLVWSALDTVPKKFSLYGADGTPKVFYGGDTVQFDPGSSGVNILDPETLEQHPAKTADFVRFLKVAEGISEYDAQSTAVVCHEVPNAIQDLYRLYLVLLYSAKPIVTGAFSNKTVEAMIDMLAIFSGGREDLRLYPRAVFDVCPSPPLIWSDFGAGQLIALARAGVPAEMVSMPLAGASAPVTLIGSVVQHAAECLSGIVIHQLAHAGSPIVWGGAPAIFDMRKGATPMGAIETGMIDSAYAEVGKFLDLPTHCYLGGTESKLVDTQTGLENGMNTLIAALSGVNMVSGAGMVDSLLCLSAEKLVTDAAAISMARRFIRGIDTPTKTLATEFFPGINFEGGAFLKQKATMQLFRREQWVPGPIIDRGSVRDWLASGRLDTFARARLEADRLVSTYTLPTLDPAKEKELRSLVAGLARNAGMDHLPDLEK